MILWPFPARCVWAEFYSGAASFFVEWRLVAVIYSASILVTGG